ncbi:MAG: rhodanese-like domain-containing protein [Spartobacteria bacterium]|nr:rhodanese-like domain-containing protein [Spartobacteria bacterium]
MNEFEKVICAMDFNYFGTSQHKMEVDAFLKAERPLLLDVRAKEELETVRLPLKYMCDVLEIPTDEVPARLDEIPRDRLIGVFCSSGVRCVIIFAYLKSKGFDQVKVLPGGYAPMMDALKPGRIYKKING